MQIDNGKKHARKEEGEVGRDARNGEVRQMMRIDAN